MKYLIGVCLLVAAQLSHAVLVIVENTADRLQIDFINDDQLNSFAPVGATGGDTLEISSGGESASIAISVLIRDSSNTLTDLMFVGIGIQGDLLLPGPVAKAMCWCLTQPMVHGPSLRWTWWWHYGRYVDGRIQQHGTNGHGRSQPGQSFHGQPSIQQCTRTLKPCTLRTWAVRSGIRQKPPTLAKTAGAHC